MSPQKLIAVIMLVSLTFGAGLEVNVAHLVAVLKNYRLLAGALLANVVIVPILGVLLVRALNLDPLVATGFLLMAIAPGVPFLVKAAGRKKGGSLGLAVTLAVILPAISILTVPLTASFVLPPSQAAHVPVAQFFMTLVLFQLVPIVLGVLVADRVPALAAKLQRPMLILFLITLVALLAMLAPKLISDVKSVYGSRGMFAALILTLLAVGTGWLLGGPEREYRRTLAIGTGLRNIGLCALIATANFPDSIVASTVMSYLLVQFVVCALIGMYFTRTATPVAAGAASV